MKDVEMPSGKGAGDENFPVGSRLLSAALRPDVMAFYRFVRAADDVADHSELSGEEKRTRLDLFERALRGDRHAMARVPTAGALRASLARRGVSERHALDLLKAFKQDAVKRRYRDWQDLLDYCSLSASPVGRYLLDLHGENQALYRFSDPLCDVLQILNHLQDCRDDFRSLDRVYLPLDGFAAAGIEVGELDRPAASPAVRSILDHALDGADRLLQRAADLPRMLASRRLAAESAVILEVARRLSAMLRRHDPLAIRVTLSKPGFLLTAVLGIGRLQWLRRGGAGAFSSRSGATP